MMKKRIFTKLKMEFEDQDDIPQMTYDVNFDKSVRVERVKLVNVKDMVRRTNVKTDSSTKLF